jgi:hypothetical protein
LALAGVVSIAVAIDVGQTEQSTLWQAGKRNSGLEAACSSVKKNPYSALRRCLMQVINGAALDFQFLKGTAMYAFNLKFVAAAAVALSALLALSACNRKADDTSKSSTPAPGSTTPSTDSSPPSSTGMGSTGTSGAPATGSTGSANAPAYGTAMPPASAPANNR